MLDNKVKLGLGFIFFIWSISFLACTSSKHVVYMYDLKDSVKGTLPAAHANFENLIQKNDQLWITVGGSNIQDLLVVNSAAGLPAGGGGANLPQGSSAIGFIVESDGKIKLPYLGAIQAEGITRIQLEAVIKEKMKDYTRDPVVNVRFLNYNFSVLGEVAKPGRFTMPTERTTILEALSMAGDIGELGKRNNVLVIREINGQREFARLNILSKEIFNSPYFYLKTNDVVYVEPIRTRFFNRTGVPQYFSIAAVGLSLLITLINIRK